MTKKVTVAEAQVRDDKIIKEEMERLKATGIDTTELEKFLLDRKIPSNLEDPELKKYGCFD